MLPSIDAPATRPPPFSVDYGAGLRLNEQVRARQKAMTEEFEKVHEHIAAELRAWQVALQRCTAFLDAFDDVR